MKIKSLTNPELEYDLDLVQRTCSCPSFKYRAECKHIKLYLNIGFEEQDLLPILIQMTKTQSLYIS